MYDLELEDKQEWKQNSIQVAKAAAIKISSFWPSSLSTASSNILSATSTTSPPSKIPFFNNKARGTRVDSAAAAAETSLVSPSLLEAGAKVLPSLDFSHPPSENVELKGEPFQLSPINKSNVSLFRQLNLSLFPVIYQETFYQNVIRKYSPFLSKIAYHNGQAIGAISCRKEVVDGFKRVYIMTIGILDSYRRFGLGSVMLSRILDACERDYTVQHVCLHVHVLNTAALAFYERNGFKIDKRVDNYYEKNVIEPPDAYFLKRERYPS